MKIILFQFKFNLCESQSDKKPPLVLRHFADIYKLHFLE